MKRGIHIYLLFLIIFASSLISCKSKSNQKQPLESVVDTVKSQVSEYMKTYYDSNKTIDSLVHLSFLGYGLGEPIKNRPKVIKTTTITKERACEYESNKVLTIQGRTIPVKVSLLTVNDTIWHITGVILNDCFSEIVSTYQAKYGYPTYGKIEDEEKYQSDTFTSFHWKFTNQEIALYRTAERKVNFDARPISEYLALKNIEIVYNDDAWRNRYYTLMREQDKYDKEMQPIRDSIEAVKLKAQQDSIAKADRQRRMKDTNQI